MLVGYQRQLPCKSMYVAELQRILPILQRARLLQGVMPGEYQVIWRMMKVGMGNIGWANSVVMMSTDTDRVHPIVTGSSDNDSATCHMQRQMQQFNDLPARQWVDVPAGSICIREFSNVSTRLWCHSGDWKHGLAWDSVRLKDLNQPTAVEPQVQHAVPSAATAIAGTVLQRVQAAGDACRLQ